MKACCNGCSAPFAASPSMVVTLAPSFMTANVRQEFALRPPARTAQAPHGPCSQPSLVPVRLRRSRSASSKVVHGATVNVRFSPFMSSETVSAAISGPLSSALRLTEDFFAMATSKPFQHQHPRTKSRVDCRQNAAPLRLLHDKCRLRLEQHTTMPKLAAAACNRRGEARACVICGAGVRRKKVEHPNSCMTLSLVFHSWRPECSLMNVSETIAALLTVRIHAVETTTG